MPESDWRLKPVEQEILLGEYVLFRPRFEALVCEANFLRMPDGLDEHPPLEKMRAARADACSMESYPTGRVLPQLSFIDGYLRYVPSQYKHYYIQLDGTFESYLAAFRSKTRSTLKRKVRKLKKELPNDQEHFRVFDQPEQVDEFVTLAHEVGKKTFQEHLFGYAIPDTPEFRQRLKEQVRNGEAEGYLLSGGGQPLAYILGTVVHGDIIIYDYVGHDPKYSKLSPGTVIQYCVIEHLFKHPRLRVYDLCTGEGAHKRLFATDHKQCADIHYFRPKPRNLGILSTHFAFQKASRGVVWTLERFELKSRVKSALRALSTRKETNG